MYLLDTNICIYIIKKTPPAIVEKIKTFQPNHIKISAISLAEMEYGVAKSVYREKNKAALIDFVSAFDIIAFDDNDAELYGLIRANLEQRGCVIGPYDMEIAAQALSRNLTLVTNNVFEFERIPNLKIENWA